MGDKPDSKTVPNNAAQVNSSHSEAIGAGVVSGMFAGPVAHFISDGKLTFPVFIVVYILFLARLNGWSRLTGLLVFACVGGGILALLEALK